MSDFWDKSRKNVTVYLDKKDLLELSNKNIKWATDYLLKIKKADLFFEEFKDKKYCPVCYREPRKHNMDSLIRCSHKYQNQQSCDHEWSYAPTTGDDVCRKCGLVV